MNRKDIIDKIRNAIREIEPEAEIFLYGSRARGDAQRTSDWDLLILLNGLVDYERIYNIRSHLIEVELEVNEILSSIIMNKDEWDLYPFRATPFHENVTEEGIRI